MQLVIQQPHAEDHQQTSHRADDDGAEGVGHIAGSSDSHQAGQGGIQTHGHVRLAVAHPGEDHANNRSNGGSHRGGQEHGAQLLHRGAGSAVEAVPAQPQDEHAQAAQGQVVTGEGVHTSNFAVLVLGELADTGSENLRTDEGGDAAHHMNGAGAGEIMEAQLRQPAAAPDPVSLDGVDQRGNHRGVDAVRKELGALSHGAGHDGGGGGAEHQVEHEAREIEILIGGEDVQAWLADEAQPVLAQQEGEADEDKHAGADAEIHQVLHQDIAGVLGAGEARLHHGEARLHPEHQRRANQKPNGEYGAVDAFHDTFQCQFHT